MGPGLRCLSCPGLGPGGETAANKQQGPCAQGLTVSWWDGGCSPSEPLLLLLLPLRGQRSVQWDYHGVLGGVHSFPRCREALRHPCGIEARAWEEGVQVGLGASKGETGGGI